jgi:hypothetical protein
VDQDTAQAIASIREQLQQLHSALGVIGPNAAETEVMELKAQVDGLVEWAQTVTPPYNPVG